MMKQIQMAWKRLAVIGLFSFLIAINLVAPVTTILTGGKTFAGRSIPVQTFLFGSVFLLIAAILWLGTNILSAWLLHQGRSARLLGWIERSLYTLSRWVWIRRISLCIVLAGLIFLLAINLRIVFFPYQMEFREGAIVLTNTAFLKGINPWALENNLQYINVYGIVYNALILPFTWLMGNQLWIYRLVSMLAILGQMLVVGMVMRRKGFAWLYIGMAALFLWLGQIYYTTPMARPDTLGQLFFLLTLFLPAFWNYSTKSLIWSGAFAVLGFYTKTYFVLGLPLLAMYLFLFRSKSQAIWYAAASTAVIMVAALVINHFFEAYFLNVVFSHIADTNQIFSYMIEQSIQFARDYWAYLFFGLLAVISAMRKLRWSRSSLPDLQIAFRQPLLTKSIDPNLFYLLVCALLIYFSLGRHNGTRMAYYYQLLSPFFLLLVFGFLHKTPRLSGLAAILLTINLLTHGYENLKPDLQPYPIEEWRKIGTLLDEHEDVPNSPAITYELIRRDLPVVNSGQTSYYYPYPEFSFFLYPDPNRIRLIGEQFLEDFQANLTNKKYDLMVVDYPYPAFAKGSVYRENYLPGEIITISMPHTMQTWQVQVMIPKPE